MNELKTVNGNMIKFDDIKDDIVNALKKKDLTKCGIHEAIALVDGFVTTPLHQELSNTLSIGSSSAMPLVTFLGRETGRFYSFAIKDLIDLPEII